ncbi:MAG: radical SAM protein [Candidatus Aureabacteria bacterium]|nr:radical SAM protein [Candidatus Auribacterota bacterium]
MKVQLVYPPLIPGQKPRYGLQPLGALYLATFLQRRGIETGVIDGEIKGLTVDEIVQRIAASAPDLIGISAMTPQLPVALTIARQIKSLEKNIKTCLGGAHANATMEESLTICPELDFVIYGEGEYPLWELCLKPDNHHWPLVEGLIYRDGTGKIQKNRHRAFIPDIDELNPLSYRMLDMISYSMPYLPGKNVASMIVSRGCPYHCSYCDAYISQGKKLRLRTPALIVDEIRSIVQDHGIRHFSFKDSTFTLNRAHSMHLMEEIQRANLKMSWRCNSRVDCVDRELLGEMKKAGCSMILYGAESGSQTILDNLQKGTTVGQIIEAFRMTHEAGIKTYAAFMLGNPGETQETAQQTIDLAKKLNPDIAVFFFTTAYPGTAIYTQGLRDHTVQENWWHPEHYRGELTSFSTWLSSEGGKLKIAGFDHARWIKKAFREFYFRPRFILRAMKETLCNPSYLWVILSLLPNLTSFLLRKKQASTEERI